MANIFYNINRQKLLFMVEELHKRGFENLRVIPSLSPSGIYWRCKFVNGKENKCYWLYPLLEEKSEEVKQTTSELADLFIKERHDFIETCKGENKEYTEWFSEMVNSLETEELPYAFSDYFSPTDFWKTSAGREIKTLPNEKDYYFI